MIFSSSCFYNIVQVCGIDYAYAQFRKASEDDCTVVSTDYKNMTITFTISKLLHNKI